MHKKCRFYRCLLSFRKLACTGVHTFTPLVRMQLEGQIARIDIAQKRTGAFIEHVWVDTVRT
jgi:hypothetical protein